MRDQITVTVTDDEDNKIKFLSNSGNTDYTESGYKYSVSRYFEIVRNTPGYESLIPLVNAMDNYGKYAQLYFGHNASDLTVEDVSDVTASVLEAYKNVRVGTLPEGLTYAGSALTLESVTKYSHHFALEAGHDISEYRFEVDGVEVTPEKSGNAYLIVIDNIAAKRLGDFTTTVVYDSDDNPVYSIKYCALSYARTVVKNEAREADVCRALYKYYVAAKDWFDNH